MIFFLLPGFGFEFFLHLFQAHKTIISIRSFPHIPEQNKRNQENNPISSFYQGSKARISGPSGFIYLKPAELKSMENWHDGREQGRKQAPSAGSTWPQLIWRPPKSSIQTGERTLYLPERDSPLSALIRVMTWSRVSRSSGSVKLSARFIILKARSLSLRARLSPIARKTRIAYFFS